MKVYIVLLIGILLLFCACEVHKPSLPIWEVDLKIPLVNDLYYISDLVDSVNIIIGENDLLYLTGSGEVDTPEIGRVALRPSINQSDIPLPSGIHQSVSLPFQDLTGNAVLTYGELASGSIKFRFRDIVDEANVLRVIFSDITDNLNRPLTVDYTGNDEWQQMDLIGYHFGVYNTMTELSMLEVALDTSSSLPDGSILGVFDIQMDEELEFSVFQGGLNRLEVSINSSSASIDIDYPNDIDQAVVLSGAQLQIDVINNMGFSCEFVGYFEARRDTLFKRERIVDKDGNNYRIEAADGDTPSVNSLLFEENISALLQIMPEHIEIVDAMFIIDTNSGFGTLRQENRIEAKYTVNAPFRFKLNNHTVSVEDPVKINISKENRDQISKNLMGAGLKLEVMNKIPIGGSIKAYFGIDPEIDPADPETYKFSKELEMQSSLVTDDWQVLPELSLTKSELDIFSYEEVYLKWEFNLHKSDTEIEIHAGSGDFLAVRSMLLGKLRIDQGSN